MCYPVLQFLDEVFESGMLLCLCAFVFRAVNRQRQSVSWASAKKTEIFTEARSFSAENHRAKLRHSLCSSIQNKVHQHAYAYTRDLLTNISKLWYADILTELTDLVRMMEKGSLLLNFVSKSILKKTGCHQFSSFTTYLKVT